MFKLFWIMAFRTWVQSTLYEVWLISYDPWLDFVDFICYSKYNYLTYYIPVFASILQTKKRPSHPTRTERFTFSTPQLIPEARSLFACSPRVGYLSWVEFLLVFSRIFPQSWIFQNHGSICRERYRTSSWMPLFFTGNHRGWLIILYK